MAETTSNDDLGRNVLGESWIDIRLFDNSGYDPGGSRWSRLIWYFLSLLVFESGWMPFYRPKQWLLRLMGARIGRELFIKPHVRIKYPWRFVAGDYCCIGQNVWIDNIADVRLGNHACVSQQAYLCTGSHDYRRRAFDMIARPIEVGDGAWIAARSLILGGLSIGANAVVAAGSVVTKDVAPADIVAGNPARTIGRRPAPTS